MTVTIPLPAPHNMVQYCRFDSKVGGFVLHNIRIEGSPNRFSAWFDREGRMLDCDASRRDGVACHVGRKQKLELAKVGKRWYEARYVPDSERFNFDKLAHKWPGSVGG